MTINVKNWQINPQSRGFISAAGGALYVFVIILTSLAMPSGSDSAGFGTAFLIATLGALIGGAIGALISPSESSEKETFKAVLGIASVFLTGFILKSFEHDIHGFFVKDLPQNPLVQVRFFSFSVAAFLGAFVMFAYRTYGKAPDEKKAQENIADIRKALGSLERIVALPKEASLNEAADTAPKNPM